MAIREVDLGNVRGDINDSEATFSQATVRANINSGEKGKTIFGKIKKWFSDMGNAAFCLVVNNATTTVANTVLDGRMGKTLMDKIAELNRNKVENTVVNNIIKAGNILSNALIVDTTSAYSDINYSKYVVMGGTTANIPANCAWGMRETLYINQNAILVKIVGIKTDGSTTCVWINAYNTGAWRGWQEH